MFSIVICSLLFFTICLWLYVHFGFFRITHWLLFLLQIEKAYVHPESDAHIYMQIFRTNISSLKLPVGYLSALMSAVPPDLLLCDLINTSSHSSPSQSPLLMTSLRIVQLRLPYSTYNTYPAMGYVFQLAAGKVLFTYIHSVGLSPPPTLCGR